MKPNRILPILPDWPAPRTVRALASSRVGGVSVAPYSGLNLAMHVGDDPQAVADNRRQLAGLLPAEPLWLTQVHGTRVQVAEDYTPGVQADACVAHTPGLVCVVLCADCLPVLFCDEGGTVVAAAHAGWRGLAAGVLEATVAAMDVAPGRLMAWFGPAIAQPAFEVGAEVRGVFVGHDAKSAEAFLAQENGSGKWLCDLTALARLRLAAAGVTRLIGGGPCTFSDPRRFYSYRRDGVTGRMATLIWLE